MSDKIIQTGIGLEQETLARCDRLRACFGRSRSWVIESALRKGGLVGLEMDKRAEIELFNALAKAAGVTWQEYVARYLAEFGSKTYPPTTETLEKMKFTGEKSVKAAKRAGQARAMAALRDVQRAQVPVESVESVAPETEQRGFTLPAPMGLRDLA